MVDDNDDDSLPRMDEELSPRELMARLTAEVARKADKAFRVTYRAQDVDNAELDRPASRANEFGITPAMIEAGTAAYYAGDQRFDSDEDIVVRIFRAMVLAKDVRRAFDAYVSRCDDTLHLVFGRSGNESVDLRSWLYDVGNNDESRADLVHNEPLYMVSEFLGIDEQGVDFPRIEAKYLEIAEREDWL